MKSEFKSILIRIIRTILGLVLAGFGIHITISANIGLSPWEAFNMGISYIIHTSYGTATLIMSFIIIGIDILLKENIGYGTLLDAIIVGKATDFFNYLNIVPKANSIFIGIILMLIGLFTLSFAIYLYMSSALGCGPRDMLLVALGKRFMKIPIGIVTIMLFALVVICGYFLGAPIGLGTLISVAGMGSFLQLVFKLTKYEPRNTKHEDIFYTTRSILRLFHSKVRNV